VLREKPDNYVSFIATWKIRVEVIADFPGDVLDCPKSQPVLVSHRGPGRTVQFVRTGSWLLDVQVRDSDARLCQLHVEPRGSRGIR
jgi:hypothetical protein